jgi:chromosome segregation ATPase
VETTCVIEYALLFGLGFLSAILLVSLMAPAIHRRIVVYTEKRLRATMPISPQEVRAQKDMARALYAAENARTRQELDAEREKALSLKFRNENAVTDASKLLGETRDLKTQLEQMTLEASDLRAKARRHEDAAARLKAALNDAEETALSRTHEISSLTKRVSAISRELDDLKITLSAREIEVEQAKHKTASWRRERETLTKELEEANAKNREAANHMNRESRKVARLEEQLAQEAARNADHETLLERRAQEVARLKERVAGISETAPVEPVAAVAAPIIQLGEKAATPDRLAREIEDIRNQGTALTERLLNGKGNGNDDAIRREISQIAARMIALTAAQEGETSPVHAMIADVDEDGGRKNLANRAIDAMGQLKN